VENGHERAANEDIRANSVPASNYRPAWVRAGGQPAPMGKDDRASDDLPSLRFVSRSNRRKGAASEGRGVPRVDEMGSAVRAAEVAARLPNHAGDGSGDRRNAAGRIRRGCKGASQSDGTVHATAQGFCVGTPSYFWGHGGQGVDALGVSAHGSPFEAVRRVTDKAEGGQGPKNRTRAQNRFFYLIPSLLRFFRRKTEANVIGGPFALSVAEFRAEGFLHFGEVGGALVRGQSRAEILGEGF
jgi:hypothetical protein